MNVVAAILIVGAFGCTQMPEVPPVPFTGPLLHPTVTEQLWYYPQFSPYSPNRSVKEVRAITLTYLPHVEVACRSTFWRELSGYYRSDMWKYGGLTRWQLVCNEPNPNADELGASLQRQYLNERTHAVESQFDEIFSWALWHPTRVERCHYFDLQAMNPVDANSKLKRHAIRGFRDCSGPISYSPFVACSD